MFGKLLKSVSWQVRAELRRSLKSNQDYKNFAGTGWREYLLPAPPITSGLCWSSGPQPSGLFAWSNIFALYYNLSLCSILRALPRFQVGCLIYWVAS